MRPRGIPASPDRRRYRLFMMLGTTVALVLAVSILVVFQNTRFDRRHGSLPDEVEQQVLQGSHTRAHAELVEAVRAARGFTLERLSPVAYRDVEWLHTSHEGHRGWYRFDLVFQAETRQGDLHYFQAEVVAILSRDGHWRTENIRIDQVEEDQVRLTIP